MKFLFELALLTLISIVLFSCKDSEVTGPSIPPSPVDNEDKGSWTQLTAMPMGKKEISNATVTLNGKIYVFGGVGANGQISNTLTIYDIATDQWSLGADLMVPVWRSIAATLNNKIYLFGGYTSLPSFPFTPTDESFEYDPELDLWTPIAPMPVARGSATSVSLLGKIHVLSGASNSALRSHHIYTPTSNTWTNGPSLIDTRSGLTSAVINNTIYVFGGYELGNGVISKNTIEKFENNTWEMVANLPVTRHGIDAIELNSRIYIFGGTASSAFSTLEFNPATIETREVAPMISPVSFMGVALFNDEIYVIGGGRVNLNRTDGLSITRKFTIKLD